MLQVTGKKNGTHQSKQFVYRVLNVFNSLSAQTDNRKTIETFEDVLNSHLITSMTSPNLT